MRFTMTGGAWTNAEDEILKTGILKYGPNQWDRIASMIHTKSPDQCKARWNEWLNPSIKKIEWTRQEDEKLLHLAKMMPAQWRTIAPLVGRTAAQCLERYEELLDSACGKDERYSPANDPRKLRPGEIDPNPETRPAKPDPVDMDECQKQMLSEARARLANTLGKKAKRKAREKLLGEARSLAASQKRRELKAAGIGSGARKRNSDSIDYNAEIPFQKLPPPGLFEVSGEDTPGEKVQLPTSVEELEGKRRVDVEAGLRKQDVARNQVSERQNAPAAPEDSQAARKRAKMVLPAPDISERELQAISEMSSSGDVLRGNDEGGGGDDRALVEARRNLRESLKELPSSENFSKARVPGLPCP